MPSVAEINRTAPPVLGELFSFFQSYNLTPDSTYENYVDAADRFLEKRQREDVLKTFESFSFNLDKNVLSFNTKISPAEKQDVILTFENFCKTVYNAACEIDQRFYNFKGLERLSSPPLEVYKYVGHNELSVKPSRSVYSSLFLKS